MDSITPCSHLAGLADYEVTHGNVVASTEARPESDIDRFILFRDKLRILGQPATGNIPRTILYWDLTISDTSAEAGFRCPEHRCIVAGPADID